MKLPKPDELFLQKDDKRPGLLFRQNHEDLFFPTNSKTSLGSYG